MIIIHCDNKQKRNSEFPPSQPTDQGKSHMKKRGMYIDQARELNKLWKLKVTVIKIVIDALGRLSKGA